MNDFIYYLEKAVYPVPYLPADYYPVILHIVWCILLLLLFFDSES